MVIYEDSREPELWYTLSEIAEKQRFILLNPNKSGNRREEFIMRTLKDLKIELGYFVCIYRYGEVEAWNLSLDKILWLRQYNEELWAYEKIGIQVLQNINACITISFFSPDAMFWLEQRFISLVALVQVQPEALW